MRRLALIITTLAFLAPCSTAGAATRPVTVAEAHHLIHRIYGAAVTIDLCRAQHKTVTCNAHDELEICEAASPQHCGPPSTERFTVRVYRRGRQLLVAETSTPGVALGLPQ